MGGKHYLRKDIVWVLQTYLAPHQTYVEPFVGGGNVMSEMTAPYQRYGYDANGYVIALYKAIQEGWRPPTEISEDEYNRIKANRDINPALAGFAGFSCSYAGNFFRGYARSYERDGSRPNYALRGYNSIMRKMSTMQNVHFEQADYRDLNLTNSLVYCDPPYAGCEDSWKVGKFDTTEFWSYMRKWSMNNTVIISEYEAPLDFRCIWQREVRISLRDKVNARYTRIEKLFIYNKECDK
jgi:DNA adenine methylase